MKNRYKTALATGLAAIALSLGVSETRAIELQKPESPMVEQTKEIEKKGCRREDIKGILSFLGLASSLWLLYYNFPRKEDNFPKYRTPM